MSAQLLLRQGRLGDAIAAQTQEVKARPADTDRRFQLFTLLAFAGELERAELQLEALMQVEAALTASVPVYRSLLAAELERRKVHREGARPVLPPDAPRTVELRLAALGALREGDFAGAEGALEEAQQGVVALGGKLNGEAFEGLRDYDDVLGQVLEVYAGGRCIWMPLELIRRIEIAAPSHQLDLLWASATLDDASGNQASVHLPVLYEGSHTHPNERVRLGRTTEWLDREVAFRGAGQKLLLAVQEDSERETGILEVRSLELSP